MSKRHRHDIEGTPAEQLCYPGIGDLMDADAMNGRSGAMYQQLTNVAVAALADTTQTLPPVECCFGTNPSQAANALPKRTVVDGR